MDPVDVVPSAVAAVGHDSASQRVDFARDVAPLHLQQRKPQRVRIPRFRHAMKRGVGICKQVVIGAKGDEVDRVPLTKQVRGQGVIGAIHAAGCHKIAGDERERGLAVHSL